MALKKTSDRVVVPFWVFKILAIIVGVVGVLLMTFSAVVAGLIAASLFVEYISVTFSILDFVFYILLYVTSYFLFSGGIELFKFCRYSTQVSVKDPHIF